MKILGIETSCDETAASVVEDGRIIHSNIISSQIDIHSRYGGVVPEVASRQHMLSIIPVIEQAMQAAKASWSDIDAIAVTKGPGLAGSLLVGVNSAKGIALGRKKTLIGINHMEGHIYANWLTGAEITFPVMCLIVSGGHSDLVLMRNHGQYEMLGRTRDDAAGEAFDKVARLLSLPYPGGPSIQKAAEDGNPRAFPFPRARLEGTWDFSFSGLKTAVLRLVRKFEEENRRIPVDDIAASFQAAVVDVLFSKTLAAARTFSAKEIVVAGGVSANRSLRETFLSQKEFPVHIPPLSLCTDNAAMIASAGYFRYVSGQRDSLDLDVLPTWPLS